jgi:putative peptidoglycan lipid II flippase
MIITLTIPATIGLILLGRPLLALVYQRGAFDANATEAVFIALQFYALGLTGHACLEIAARAFFAQQDTVTPLIIAAIFGAINVVLALLLMPVLGHGGLALANSVAVSVEVLTLLLVLRRRLAGMDGRAIGRTLLQALLAASAMGLIVWGILQVGQARWPMVVTVALAAAGGGTSYIGLGLLLRMRPLLKLPATLLGKG